MTSELIFMGLYAWFVFCNPVFMLAFFAIPFISLLAVAMGA